MTSRYQRSPRRQVVEALGLSGSVDRTPFRIGDSVFSGKQKIAAARSHSLVYGRIVDTSSGEVVDTVLVGVMKGPRTYTGEDTIEISCHGGLLNTKRILQLTIDSGARLAEPGEFTKLAFMNGRMDLAQAEAVAEIINARTEAARRASMSHLLGRVSDEVTSLRSELIELCSLIELDLDFAEENLLDVNRGSVANQLQRVSDKVKTILATYHTGHLLREGARVTIVGKPNTGKSTLLNKLLQRERAIVSDVAGTTRDFIEEVIDINGIPFTVVDTAGIRETRDTIELAGIEMTESHSAFSDLVLALFDGSDVISVDDERVIGFCRKLREKTGPNILAVLNKADKTLLTDTKAMLEDAQFSPVEISALSGTGIEELKQRISEIYGENLDTESVIISNLRQKELFQDALLALNRAGETIQRGVSFEFAAVDIREAMDRLGQIIGETTTDNILNHIFSGFCIGK